MLESSELRLNAEPDVVTSLHPARGVRDAEDFLGRTLRDATLAVAGEPRDREARTTVVDRVGPAGEIAQTDVPDPIPPVQADGRRDVVTA